MDLLGIIDLPRWLLCILAFIVTLILYTAWKKSIFRRLGVVTKPSRFILGDFGELGKKGLSMYDHKMVNKYGKVFGTFWGNRPLMIISDVDMIKQIAVREFSNFSERFSFRDKLEDMNLAVTSAKGHHWKFLRTTLSSSFATGKIRIMNGHITNCLAKLHKNLEEQSRKCPDGFDIYHYIVAFTLDVICSTGFGIDVDSQGDPDNEFVRNAKLFMSSQMAGNPLIIFKAIFPDLPGLDLVNTRQFDPKTVEFFRTATRLLFEERKQSSADHRDLLQGMINSQREASDLSNSQRQQASLDDMRQTGLTDTEVIANSMIFMLAGFDTTAAVLGWTVYDLATNTRCQDKLIKEIDEQHGEAEPTYDTVFKLQYLDQVLSETLRMHPVGLGMLRRAVNATEVCGVTIPRDMWILVPATACHFMTEFWENPQRYQPERFAPENKDNLLEYAYMPFGHGPRNCIGMRLALFEVKMTLVSIFQKYRVLKGDNLSVPMKGTIKGILKPAQPVLVKLVKRK